MEMRVQFKNFDPDGGTDAGHQAADAEGFAPASRLEKIAPFLPLIITEPGRVAYGEDGPPIPVRSITASELECEPPKGQWVQQRHLGPLDNALLQMTVYGEEPNIASARFGVSVEELSMEYERLDQVFSWTPVVFVSRDCLKVGPHFVQVKTMINDE